LDKTLPAIGIVMTPLHLFIAGTGMLLANGAGADSAVKPFHLEEASISDVHAAHTSDTLTAAKLVQACLERIQAYDQALQGNIRSSAYRSDATASRAAGVHLFHRLMPGGMP